MEIKKALISRNYLKGRKGYNGKGNYTIQEITVHHAAGAILLPNMYTMFNTPGKDTSSHYGIRDHEVMQFVDEADTAFTNSNETANSRAVTIEVSNSASGGEWPVSSESYDTLIDLVYDIAKRNNLLPLVKGVSLTWHRMYSNTTCPGDYLFNRLNNIVNQVNALHAAETGAITTPTMYRIRKSWDDVRSQEGAYTNLANAKAHADKLNNQVSYKVYDNSGNQVYPK